MGGLITGPYSIYSADDYTEMAKQAAQAQLAASNASAIAAAGTAESYYGQAEIAENQAGFAQIQGEDSASKRSKTLANDIGETYAEWAGNGLMVSGSDTGTFNSVLRSQKNEAKRDIETINENTGMSVWTLLENAANLRTSGRNSSAYAAALRQAGIAEANSTLYSGELQRRSAIVKGFGDMLGGGGQVFSFYTSSGFGS